MTFKELHYIEELEKIFIEKKKVVDAIDLLMQTIEQKLDSGYDKGYLITYLKIMKKELGL